MERARLATAAILLLVFASGALVGMALDGGAEASPATATTEGEAVSEEPEQPERRGRIFDQVNPSPEQKAKMDSIVVFHRERMRALNEEFREAYYPRFYGLIDEARVRIKQEMTAEQAAKYDSLLAEFDRKNRNEEGRLPFRGRD